MHRQLEEWTTVASLCSQCVHGSNGFWQDAYDGLGRVIRLIAGRISDQKYPSAF